MDNKIRGICLARLGRRAGPGREKNDPQRKNLIKRDLREILFHRQMTKEKGGEEKGGKETWLQRSEDKGRKYSGAKRSTVTDSKRKNRLRYQGTTRPNHGPQKNPTQVYKQGGKGKKQGEGGKHVLKLPELRRGGGTVGKEKEQEKRL